MKTAVAETPFARVLREHAARRIADTMADATPESFGLWLEGLDTGEAERIAAWMRRALEVSGA